MATQEQTNPTEAAPQITAQQIEEWRHGRSQQAAEAIQAALQAYNCVLVAVPRLTEDGRIVASAQVVAK